MIVVVSSVAAASQAHTEKCDKIATQIKSHKSTKKKRRLQSKVISRIFSFPFEQP